jgi:hypothetical protein
MLMLPNAPKLSDHIRLPRVSFASSHRTRIKGKGRRKLHRCGESKRVHVEHRIVRVEELCHGAESLGIVAHLQTLVVPLMAHLLLAWHLVLIELVLRGGDRCGIWAWPGFGWILVIDHVGLGIVLLFCTHGINLGRT